MKRPGRTSVGPQRVGRRRGIAVATTLSLISLLLAGCGESGSGGLFTTTCADIGKRPADLKDSESTEVIVLLDVTSNDAATAKRIAGDTAAVLDTVLANNDDLVVTGFTAGGTDETVNSIDCMENHEYFFGGGNKRRQDQERKDLRDFLATAMDKAVTQTRVAETGDARVLLRKVPTIATRPGARVILWSSFLEQGSDCLTFEQTDHPSVELAQSVAQRCAEQGLLPDLKGAELTIVGAGSSPGRPDLGPFGKALAASLCARMTDSCDVR